VLALACVLAVVVFAMYICLFRKRDKFQKLWEQYKGRETDQN
jgi:hypothetical protein